MRVIAGPYVDVNAANGGRGGGMPIAIPLIMGFRHYVSDGRLLAFQAFLRVIEMVARSGVFSQLCLQLGDVSMHGE